MKIGVMSDSHDRFDGIAQAIRVFEREQVDMIVHCGDWVAPVTFVVFMQQAKALKVPIKAVFGNNEGDQTRILQKNYEMGEPVEFSLTGVLGVAADKRKLAVYHGQDTLILDALISCGDYDAVLTGHTHAVRNEQVGSTLVLNPGATCYYQGMSMVDNGSVALYDTATNSAEIVAFPAG